MWDRLLVDCNVATMVPAPNNPLGIIENGAIAIEDGRILRVGKRTELAGCCHAPIDHVRSEHFLADGESLLMHVAIVHRSTLVIEEP